MDKETMEQLAQSHDELARVIRDAFQPLVDAFVRIAKEWNIEPPHDYRHLMRRKIRRMFRA